MVYYFSDLTYEKLTRSINQVDTLAGKSAFERWDATFGVKIDRYHADNGRFAEQPFR